MVKVFGKTFPVKDALRDMGGKWNAGEKCWEVPDDKGEDAKKLVGSVIVTNRDNSAYGQSQQKKKCWECGCSFTFSDAKRNGGDWRDSYCGC